MKYDDLFLRAHTKTMKAYDRLLAKVDDKNVPLQAIRKIVDKFYDVFCTYCDVMIDLKLPGCSGCILNSLEDGTCDEHGESHNTYLACSEIYDDPESATRDQIKTAFTARRNWLDNRVKENLAR